MLTHQARFCSRVAGAIPSLRHQFSRNPSKLRSRENDRHIAIIRESPTITEIISIMRSQALTLRDPLR
jgi:hypothetical protein